MAKPEKEQHRGCPLPVPTTCGPAQPVTARSVPWGPSFNQMWLMCPAGGCLPPPQPHWGHPAPLFLVAGPVTFCWVTPQLLESPAELTWLPSAWPWDPCSHGSCSLSGMFMAKTGKSAPRGHWFCRGPAAPARTNPCSPGRMGWERVQAVGKATPPVLHQLSSAQTHWVWIPSAMVPLPLQWGPCCTPHAHPVHVLGTLGCGHLTSHSRRLTWGGCWGQHWHHLNTGGQRPLRDAAHVPGLVLLRMLLWGGIVKSDKGLKSMVFFFRE